MNKCNTWNKIIREKKIQFQSERESMRAYIFMHTQIKTCTYKRECTLCIHRFPYLIHKYAMYTGLYTRMYTFFASTVHAILTQVTKKSSYRTSVISLIRLTEWEYLTQPSSLILTCWSEPEFMWVSGLLSDLADLRYFLALDGCGDNCVAWSFLDARAWWQSAIVGKAITIDIYGLCTLQNNEDSRTEYV